MINYLLILSIIYIFIYQTIITFTNVFSNIFVVEYIYPYLSNLIDSGINSFIDTYNNTYYNNTYDDSFYNIYSHHNKHKTKLNNKNIYKDNNVHILSLLTCPICYNIYDKIYVCPNGHSLCSKCFYNSNICSYCRVNIDSNTRNRVLEEMLESMKLPCSYYKFGCRKNILNNNRCKHEYHCTYKPLKCHLDLCNHESNYCDMIHHINNTHNYYDIIKSNSDIHHYFQFSFDVSQNINFTSLNENCNIFKILDINNNLIFIKWFIQTGMLKNMQYNDPNELCKNKALCFVLLGIHNNKFNINIYNKQITKFGKYTLLNKLKNNIDYCNTITIPLVSVYDIKHTYFNIDIMIYEKVKRIKII